MELLKDDTLGELRLRYRLGVGDVLMMTPGLRFMRQTQPGRKLRVCVSANQQSLYAECLLEGIPNIAGFVFLGTHPRPPPSKPEDITNWSTFAADYGCTYSQYLGSMFTEGVLPPGDDLAYDYVFLGAELKRGHHLVQALGKGRPVVAVARHGVSLSSPGEPCKLIDNALWIEVARWLIRKGLVPVAVGSRGDLKDARFKEWPGPRLYGAPLREVAAFLHYCKATAAIDTGVRHMAAAVGGNLYCCSRVVPLDAIRCYPNRPGQLIFEEHNPEPTADSLIAGLEKVL